MRHRVVFALKALFPPAIAGAAVLLEPAFTAFAGKREAVLPFSIFFVLLSLIQPDLRRVMTIILCYGVSFLALRDAFRNPYMRVSDIMDYEFLSPLRMATLLLVATLSGVAAVAETLQPGILWARRFYFGAAALYFSGAGVISALGPTGWQFSGQSILLLLTGLTAGTGCLFAHRIVASELAADPDEAPPDERMLSEQAAAHAEALRRKEWRDGGL